MPAVAAAVAKKLTEHHLTATSLHLTTSVLHQLLLVDRRGSAREGGQRRPTEKEEENDCREGGSQGGCLRR
jgi:hypothetical protein